MDDQITIIGSSYFQPISELFESMLRASPPDRTKKSNYRENGYAAALVVLIVTLLESYVSRLRFVRHNEIVSSRSVPETLTHLFPDFPNKEELLEVFLLRNIVIHNHVWHLDTSNPESEAKTIHSPLDLGFDVNQHYRSIVDSETRRTKRLGFPVDPSAVDRYDVKRVFEIVWGTLSFMNRKNFSHTPLAGRTVVFRKTRVSFESISGYVV